MVGFFICSSIVWFQHPFLKYPVNRDLANVFKSLLPLNSDHVIIHLGGYRHQGSYTFDLLKFHDFP